MSEKKEILRNKINLVVLSSEDYDKSLMRFIRMISKENVCYVTLNKDVRTILSRLKKAKIKKDNFLFIDCITRTVVEPKKEENCIYVSSPNALTELSLCITKAMKYGDMKIVVIDSLSSLLVYHPFRVLLRFLNSIITKIRQDTVVLILTVAENEKNSEFVTEVKKKVDNIIEV